jgi:hypothetical protein
MMQMRKTSCGVVKRVNNFQLAPLAEEKEEYQEEEEGKEEEEEEEEEEQDQQETCAVLVQHLLV